MASKGKERENFFRINVLVVDHIKNALVDMFKYYLRVYKKNMSFEEFINAHMADIKYLKRSRNLYKEEVDKLIVDDKAISGITVDDLEVTLVRRLLDNLCPDLFMDDGCKTLQNFLKKNQHDIYHLFKFNEPCCQCSQDYKFPVTSQLLQEDQYKKMFRLSPCTNCAGTNGTVCSVSSCINTEYIEFNYKIKKEVVGHFSPIFKAMLKFTDIRNKAYGHADATVIPNEIYDVYKHDIEENIMVLARFCGNEDETRLALDDVQKRSCDETLCIQYQNRLIELVQREKEIEKRIEELAEKWETTDTNLQSVAKDVADNRQIIDRHIPSNIRNVPRSVLPLTNAEDLVLFEGHIELIKKWRLEDKLFYDETVGFTAALKMVQSENYMTIIGGPGSGKTATAHHIALQLEEQEWEVVPVCRLEEIIQYGDRDHKQVFVLDDVLGIFAVDMQFYNYIINHENNIFTAIKKTSKLLFTCRKSVYKEALKLRLFVTTHIVDLQSKDNQLTKTEKMAIFQCHCKAKGLNPDLYASLSFTNSIPMFPLLCKLFFMEEKYQQLGESFFNKPFKYFIIELDKMQKTNTVQYAVLVLCLVNEGKLSVELLPHERKQDVFNNCGANLGTPDKQIIDAIYHMSETYFTKLDTEYTFTHDFIYEVIAYHYGCQNQHHILKYLSSSYIANKVTVYVQASNEDHCIQISEDMYLPLAERLYTDIQSMNLFDVFKNKSLKHSPFRDVFEGMLKTKPFHEFESLILRKRQNIHHFVKITFSDKYKYPLERLLEMIEYDRLNLLFAEVCDLESDSEYNVKVISWIINDGHFHLLQEIVNHVKYKDHSISLIFGSSVTENARLLSLGCYSNTLDIVELILKCVDPQCIDIAFIFGSPFRRSVTPMIAGCMIGNLSIVKTLLENQADVNKCNCWNMSPLSTASNNGYTDVVKLLLNSCADINLRNIDGQSPLFLASICGHCDVVKCLLSSGADINLRNDENISPLSIAAAHGHCDVVECLLSSGADVNLCANEEMPPLYMASANGLYDVVNGLLSYGADINLGHFFGHSPLFAASWYKHFDVIKCLLSSGADINLCDEHGESPLSVASMKGDCDVVKCLLSSGADINLCNNDGESPLFIASQKGKYDVVNCLLSFGADINLCNHDGKTPLYAASHHGHCDIVKCLLSSGADINFRDKDGKTPLFVASSSGYYHIVILLTERGALREENVKAQYKTISKGIKDDVFPIDSTTLLNPCGYPEEITSHQTEKQEEEKEAINVPKVQEEKGETILTREWEDKIYMKETESIIEIDDTDSCFMSDFGYDTTSPLSIAVEKDHFDIVKHILENTTDFDLSDTGKSPLFLAAENGCYDILVLLLHSKYNDINKTYLDTTPLEIAVWKNKMKVVQLLIQKENKENKDEKYRGNYHLFEILSNLKRLAFCINEQTGKEDCQTQDRNHRHLPYPLWHLVTDSANDCLIHLLKIGLDINKCDYKGNTLLYKILNRPSWISDFKFTQLMAFEDVNVGETNWISLLKIKRELVRKIEKNMWYVLPHVPNYNGYDTMLTNHIRRNSI